MNAASNVPFSAWLAVPIYSSSLALGVPCAVIYVWEFLINILFDATGENGLNSFALDREQRTTHVLTKQRVKEIWEEVRQLVAPSGAATPAPNQVRRSAVLCDRGPF